MICLYLGYVHGHGIIREVAHDCLYLGCVHDHGIKREVPHDCQYLACIRGVCVVMGYTSEHHHAGTCTLGSSKCLRALHADKHGCDIRLDMYVT